jgi:hypothetical protein
MQGKIHMSRRRATSRLEVVPLDEATIFLTPTRNMSPAKMTPVATNTNIHVHGLLLQGAHLEMPRNILTDPLPGTTNLTPLPVMQIMSLKHSSIQAALDVSFDCPVFMTARPPPPVDLTLPSTNSCGQKQRAEADAWGNMMGGGSADGPRATGVAAGAEEASTSDPLIRMILPVESAQDHQRFVTYSSCTCTRTNARTHYI